MIAPSDRLEADGASRAFWRPGATPALLAAGAVHIWRADLDAVGAQLGMLLDERERERAERIASVSTRQRWIAARGVLRALLGAYLDEDPSALQLAQKGRGKPALDLPGRSSLHFNLSHSGPLAVYAVTEMCAVGVDVELVDRRSSGRAVAIRQPNLVALAERVLGSATAECLRKLDPRARGSEFLRAWVRHEAEGKRRGDGVRNRPDDGRAMGPRPWIAELDLGRDAVGAVALATAPVDFRVYAIDFRAYGSILPTGTTTIHNDEANVSE